MADYTSDIKFEPIDTRQTTEIFGIGSGIREDNAEVIRCRLPTSNQLF